MDKKSIKKFCWIVATSSILALITGCAEPAAPKPWDSSVFNQTSFTFSDNDPAEKMVSGDIKLSGIPKLDNVLSYLIYWGNSGSKSGKGALLKEVSGGPSGGTLYTVPKGTSLAGSNFQLYLKIGDKEEFGKSLSIVDLFVPVVKEPEPKKVVEKEPVKEVVKVPPPVEVKAPPVEVKAPPVVVEKVEVVEKELEQPQQPDAISEPVLALSPIKTPTAPTTSAAVAEPVVAEPVVVEKVEVPIKTPVIKVVIPTIYVKNVLFEFDKFNIQEDHKQQLLSTLDNLENKDTRKFLIAGHADERGSNAYNLALGERRAYEVKRFLISMGFLEENMRIVSYGEEKPADRGHNESSWAKNRRTETLDLSKEP